MACSVVVPVFNGFDATRKCLESLARHLPAGCRLFLVDDASTDPRIPALLQGFVARRPATELIANERNLGFVGAVNRAIEAAGRDDVVVLNSDTEVSEGWLEALVRCRESDPAIAMVCPLSNRATILSVPAVESLYMRPDGTVDVDALAATVRAASLRSYVRLPTAVGFCMLITRELLDRAGLLDEAYGRGYGEENDLSLRALDLSYEIACADDVFVYHAGEASFGEVAAIGETREANRARLARRWPAYEPGVAAWARRNPLRATLERVNAFAERERMPGRTRVLQVLHRFDSLGGIEEHTREIMRALRNDATFTVVVPDAVKGGWGDMRVERPEPHLRIVRVNFDIAEGGINVIGQRANVADAAVEERFRVLLAGGFDVVHFQSLVGWNTVGLARIAKESGARVVATAHDFSLMCPDYNMMTGPRDMPCGRDRARGSDEGCIACLQGKSEAVAVVRPPSISSYLEARHAALASSLAALDSIVCPSKYVEGRMRRAFGESLADKIAVVGHGVRDLARVHREASRPGLRLAFLGRFNSRKGSEIFIAAARSLAGAGIIFEIWGHAEAGAEAQARAAGILFCGPYDATRLESGLRGIDAVVVPSTMEEAYCLVVDEAMRMGIPVVAANTGAIPERVRDGENGFLFPTGDSAALARLLLSLRDDRTRIDRVAERLRAWKVKSVAENSREYLEIYRAGASRDELPKPFAEDKEELARRVLGFPRTRACTPLGTDDYDRWLKHETVPEARGHAALPAVVFRMGDADVRRVNAEVRDARSPWVALYEEGDRLAPRALERLSAACEANPLASLVYTDHDSISVRGERYDPCFKPSFSPSLLLHSSYLAGLCAVRRDAFVAAGGLREPGWRGVAELASRLVAGGRMRTVAAWPEVLCHRIDTRPARAQAFGSFAVAAPLGKISAFVCASLEPQLVATCLESMLRTAGGRIHEVFLDLDESQCAQIASSLPGVVIASAGSQGGAAIGFTIERCSGKRLVYVDGRCVNFREGWLAELEGALADAAGSCIAVRASDRVVPGWDVVGGGPQAVAGIAPPIQDDSLGSIYSAAREVGALGARLALIDRDSARAACPRRELDAAGPFALAHLSLALREQGHRLVTRPGVAADIAVAATSLVIAPELSPVSWMRTRWGERLEDPYLHPALRLTGNRLMVQPRFGARQPDVVRVCAFPYDQWGTGELRVRQPLRALERHGFAEMALMSDHVSGDVPNALELRRMSPDVVLAHNFLHDYQLVALEQYAAHSSALRVTGLDDLLTALPRTNPYSATIYGDIEQRIARSVALSDRLVVSTQPLADAYGRGCKDVRVIPNGLDDSWLELENAKRNSARPRVGWAGARQHAGDLAILEPVVRATCDAVDWVFLGMCPPSVRGLAKEVHGMVPVEQYPARLASLGLDIAVAPLVDHPFNRAKSNLRLLEYGILGIPVIASAVTPYLDSPATLVANDEASWIEAVNALAGDASRRAMEGERMRRWVSQTGTLGIHLETWRSALRRDR
jgi:GT2 family glycosyltransferase/glycosyltransferase involved in cell wall biosynthesis